jgi:hypothetical protein
MSKKALLFTLLLLLSLAWLAFPGPTFAQDPGPGPGGVGEDLDGTVDTVLDFIRQITLSALRFGLFLSGLIFLVAVVWGAARGSIATAIGNRMQASAGIVTAIMAVGTLVLVLISVPLVNVIAGTLTDQFLTPENLRMDVAGLVEGTGQGAGAPVDLENVFQIPELQTTIEDLAFSAIRFALGLGILASIVATFLGAFDTQLGSLFGGGMLAGRGIMRMMAAVGQLVVLVISLPIAKLILSVLVSRLVNLDLSLPF